MGTPAAVPEGRPIQRVVWVIVNRALEQGASVATITRRPQEQGVAVGYRIGEQDHNIMVVPDYVWKPLQEELALRIGLSLTDLPAEGVMPFTYQGRQVSVRVSLGEVEDRLTLPG